MTITQKDLDALKMLAAKVLGTSDYTANQQERDRKDGARDAVKLLFDRVEAELLDRTVPKVYLALEKDGHGGLLAPRVAFSHGNAALVYLQQETTSDGHVAELVVLDSCPIRQSFPTYIVRVSRHGRIHSAGEGMPHQAYPHEIPFVSVFPPSKDQPGSEVNTHVAVAAMTLAEAKEVALKKAHGIAEGILAAREQHIESDRKILDEVRRSNSRVGA